MARRYPFMRGLGATLVSVGVGLVTFLAWHNWLVTVAAGLATSAVVRGAVDIATSHANIAGVLAGVGAGVGSVAAGAPAYLAWGLGAGIGVGLGAGAVAAILGTVTGLVLWPESRAGIELGSSPHDFPWGAGSSRWWQRFERWVKGGSRPRAAGGRRAPQG